MEVAMDNKFDSRLDLLCQLSASDSLQKIANLGYELLGNPIFITDMSHTVLAYTSSVEIEDESWQRNVVNGQLDRNLLRQDMEVSENRQNSAKNRLPILVRDDFVPYPRLIKVLLSGNTPLGVVVCSGVLKDFEPQDVQFLELLSSFVTARTYHERYLFSPSKKAVENYLIKLLDGAALSQSQVEKRMDILGWHHLRCLYVMVMWPDDGDTGKGESLDNILSRLSGMPYCRAFIYDNSIVFLYSCEHTITNWDKEAPTLSENLRRWQLLSGVSRCFHDLSHLRFHYRNAFSALSLGKRLGKHQHIFSYNNCTTYDLFQYLPDTVPLRDFCHEKILNLKNYDRDNNSNLLVTLQVYLEQTKSLSKTADILFVHRNTVRYRIKKCMEILDTDFENGDEIFSFIFSLRIIEYLGKINKHNDRFNLEKP